MEDNKSWCQYKNEDTLLSQNCHGMLLLYHACNINEKQSLMNKRHYNQSYIYNIKWHMCAIINLIGQQRQISLNTSPNNQSLEFNQKYNVCGMMELDANFVIKKWSSTLPHSKKRTIHIAFVK